MIRRPPRSTLFPTRRSSDLAHDQRSTNTASARHRGKRGTNTNPRPAPRVPTRSEEHTSELQSLAYLVCRLLLEKKKRQNRPQSVSQALSGRPISTHLPHTLR